MEVKCKKVRRLNGGEGGCVAYRAAIVHSKTADDCIMIPDGLLVVDHGRGGLICNLTNVEHMKDEQVDEVAAKAHACEVRDLTGRMIMPGFIDTHAHAPQYAFTGTGMHLPLLKWLESYTFPCEAKFEDLEFARDVYSKSVRRHLMNGTTTCSYFATLHLEASKLLVDIVHEQGQRAYVGKVSMDRNSPDNYVEGTKEGIAAVHAFIEYTQQREKKANGDVPPELLTAFSSPDFVDAIDLKPLTRKESTSTATDVESPETSDPENDEVVGATTSKANDGKKASPSTPVNAPVLEARLSKVVRPPQLVTPVITPRFIPSCTTPMLKALAKISDDHGLPIQSHLSESKGEVAWVRELHPECVNYTDVYRTYGLLNERTYFAHCCHCGVEEHDMIKAHEAGVSHCPSSNFMLGSGVLNVRSLMRKGVKVGLGTDVAGGYSTSILDAARQAIIASRCISFTEKDEKGKPYEALSHTEVFYLATQGGANVLGLGNAIGNFEPGKYFDAIVVDPGTEDGPLDMFDGEYFDVIVVDPGTEDGLIDMFDGEHLHSAFEKFLFLGDDRNIEQVFVGGKRVL